MKDYQAEKLVYVFGAKAVAKIRDVQIHDPVTLTNTKEFLRQCFMKPYIIGNILGKKQLLNKLMIS
ncbi:putative traG protein [Orientia tsutsugamushi str. TA716]|uniref:Putative traG protein n=2 Tax=Orientia tsutsugamushi TaxID=784 RepID=A0A0F3P434_ORITS|nr:putative traG protein [Orientia tsutsugamushi str. TA716]